MDEELTCRELVELITDYFEGTLPPDDRARFEEHLQDCDPCSKYVNQMRRTIELAGRLSKETISAEATTELAHAFRAWKAGKPST
jgi:anti-sigma factor RsiW